MLTTNFLIKKVVIQKFPFNDKLFQYGYEDVVLIRELQRNAISIAQIENAAYHLQLEDSVIFLEKTKHSLANLKMLRDQNVFDDDNSSLLKTYQLI
jgi:NOL1/NOP2/fmu family ribosome biogenesis protein